MMWFTILMSLVALFMGMALGISIQKEHEAKESSKRYQRELEAKIKMLQGDIK